MPIQIGINNAIKGGSGTLTGSGGSGGIIPPPPAQFLLQEDGFKIYLENGIDFLLTE